MAPITLIYFDTNVFICVREQLESGEHARVHYGNKFDRANEVIQGINQYIEYYDDNGPLVQFITSIITEIEINSKYKEFVTNQFFLEKGFPVSMLSGSRKYQAQRPLRREFTDEDRIEIKARIESSNQWIRTWKHHDRIEIRGLTSEVFSLTEKAASAVEGIHLSDTLHVCSAIVFGCSYFVTNDSDLIRYVGDINQYLQDNELYPDGTPVYSSLEALNIRSFRDRSRQRPR